MDFCTPESLFPVCAAKAQAWLDSYKLLRFYHNPDPVSYTHLDVYKRQGSKSTQLPEALDFIMNWDAENALDYHAAPCQNNRRQNAEHRRRTEIHTAEGPWKKQGIIGRSR